MFKGVMIIYLGGGFKSIIFGIFTPENLGKFDPILGKNLNLDLFFRWYLTDCIMEKHH